MLTVVERVYLISDTDRGIYLRGSGNKKEQINNSKFGKHAIKYCSVCSSLTSIVQRYLIYIKLARVGFRTITEFCSDALTVCTATSLSFV